MEELLGIGVLDVVLQLPLCVHTDTHLYTQLAGRRSHDPASYQLVEGVFELLQTVQQLVLGGGSGAQRQDSLCGTHGR